jgi:hypothetical protein
MLEKIKEFIGNSVFKLDKELKEDGWQTISVFNDYKWVWVKPSINKSIVAKIDFIDNIELDNEIIIDIWSYDGIYSEHISEESLKIFIENLKSNLNRTQ